MRLAAIAVLVFGCCEKPAPPASTATPRVIEAGEAKATPKIRPPETWNYQPRVEAVEADGADEHSIVVKRTP